MSIGKMDSFLFVSDYEEEWQMDRDLNTNRCWPMFITMTFQISPK